MDFVGTLFGRKTSPRKITDLKSTKYFKSQNLKRNQFTIDAISQIKWWPDEIVSFLDVIKLTYIDFISSYEMNDEFDEPLRDAIFYMLKKPYSDHTSIAKFIQYNDQSIPKNYVGAMFAEDNCRMYDLDDRLRSKNDQKHLILVKALTRLLAHSPVKHERYQLGAKQEILLRRYMIIYNLRKCYASVDDMLRNILHSVFEKISGITDLTLILEELITEFQRYATSQLRYMDEKLLNKVYIFCDLLSYVAMRNRQCDLVFNSSMLEAGPIPEKRIIYVYKYFRDIVDLHNKKIEISRSSEAVMKISEAELDKREQELRMIAPRYFLSEISPRDRTDTNTKIHFDSNMGGLSDVIKISESAFAVTLNDPNVMTTKSKSRHRRQSTTEFMHIRHNVNSEKTS